MKHRLGILAAMLIWSSCARAEGPQIITDIAPIQSLTAQIMSGVGTPHLLIQPGTAPYHYRLRQRDSERLSQADLVIIVGPELTPFLAEEIAELGDDIEQLVLSELPHVIRLEARGPELAIPTDDGGLHKETNGQNADKDTNNDTNNDTNTGRLDPHLWLDPENAHYWLQVIADELALIDPENAVLYLANADLAGTNLDTVVGEIDQLLTAEPPAPFILYHDTYHYFEHRFGLQPAGALSARRFKTSRQTSYKARKAELQSYIDEQGIRCIISTPHYRPGVIEALSEGTDLQHLIIDPFGSDIAAGETFYPELISVVGRAFHTCQTD